MKAKVHERLSELNKIAVGENTNTNTKRQTRKNKNTNTAAKDRGNNNNAQYAKRICTEGKFVEVREYVNMDLLCLELWLFVDSSVLLLSCFMWSGALASPCLLPSCSIITIKLHITTHHTNNNP